jgi:hypothetical protein
MTLFDLVPLWKASIAAGLTFLAIWALVRNKTLSGVLDPEILIIFQITFTFFVLILIGLLPLGDVIGFLLFFAILGATRLKQRGLRPLISEEEWIRFSVPLFVLLLILNVYLSYHKGFLLLSRDLSTARLDFYEQWGLFKRLNDFGVGVLGISAFYMWDRGRKRLSILYFVFCSYLMLSLGSRIGLITFLPLYGAYTRFRKSKTSPVKIVVAAGVLGITSLSLFYVMFREQFMTQFLYRVIAFSDGPIYYYYPRPLRNLSYSPLYCLDQFLVAARIKPQISYLPLGRVLDFRFLGFDTPLMGPNPQFTVESHVIFGVGYLLWYVFAALFFSLARRSTSTPFSFFLVCSIVGPFLIDSQYGGSQLFTAIIGLTLLLFMTCVRKLAVFAAYSAQFPTEGQ